MSRTKIEFRCTEEEWTKVRALSDNQNLSVKDYLLNATIYKRGRSGLNTREKACICRMKTSLNKIDDGICSEEEVKKLIEECKELCQYSKQ